MAANQELEAANTELEKAIERARRKAVESEMSNRELSKEIEERKRAEEALRKSEERYRNILENIEEGYYEVDIAGNFTFFNDSIPKMLGYSKKELMGMSNRQYTDKETAERVFRTYNKVYTTGKPTKGLEHEFIRKDGTKGHIESSISLLRDAEGKPIGFRGIARDVSERKQAEALEQEKIKAEASNRAKSEFLAKMSHEMRAPLSGIIGMTELAMDTELDDNQRNILHILNTEANSLHGLINKILDFSKIEAGKLELEEIPFDLRVTIEDVAGSIAVRAEQKGLEFMCFFSPYVPYRLIGDPGRLRQVLTNLSDNALKFTHEGEIFIKGELAEELGEKVKIRFLVKDTGIGIPKEKQAAIFESFTQADGSTTRTYGGTGLGTTISKQLAELMGGEIGVESEEGKGSTFYFTAVFRKQKAAKTLLRQEPDLNNLRVLVVDDNQTNRYILTEYLRSWGCIPVEAPGGKEALCLILTDIQMPQMSGFDLAREIREIKDLKEVPIIALSSAGRRGDGKICTDIGVEGYLTKPIRRDDLHMAILSVLGLSKEKEAESSPRLVTRHSIAEVSRGEVQILLAEDYPTSQQVALRHLEGAGYQVDLAENGRQAVEAYKRKGYDLILMDIQMPVMDGYEATKAIRDVEKSIVTGHSSVGRQSTNDKWQMTNGRSIATRVPIVAMTAHALKGYRERCLEAGMDDYIAKPLRRKELVTMVDKWSKSNDDCRLSIVDSGIETPNLRCITTRNSQSKEDAPMNFEVAIQEFEGDKEFLMEVMDGFMEKVRTQIPTIHQAISDGDTETVRREAHSIKGGAANLSAKKLSGIALELENIGRSGILEGGSEVLQRLEGEFSRLEGYVKSR
jgi:two-component system sensor histidine kinase/response regulator